MWLVRCGIHETCSATNAGCCLVWSWVRMPPTEAAIVHSNSQPHPLCNCSPDAAFHLADAVHAFVRVGGAHAAGVAGGVGGAQSLQAGQARRAGLAAVPCLWLKAVPGERVLLCSTCCLLREGLSEHGIMLDQRGLPLPCMSCCRSRTRACWLGTRRLSRTSWCRRAEEGGPGFRGQITWQLPPGRKPLRAGKLVQHRQTDRQKDRTPSRTRGIRALLSASTRPAFPAPMPCTHLAESRIALVGERGAYAVGRARRVGGAVELQRVGRQAAGWAGGLNPFAQAAGTWQGTLCGPHHTTLCPPPLFSSISSSPTLQTPPEQVLVEAGHTQSAVHEFPVPQ